MGAKKNGNVPSYFCRSVFFFVGGHKKNRPTKLFMAFEALYKTCL